MVAEHHYNKLHNKTERRKTTSSRSTGLHTIEWVCSTCTPPHLQVDNSVLVVGFPRLASTSMNTLTTTSTGIDVIYMLSAPKQHPHRREAPAIFEGKTSQIPQQVRLLHSRTGHQKFRTTYVTRGSQHHQHYGGLQERNYSYL
eukprot:1907022-Amphidinium_carterae.4